MSAYPGRPISRADAIQSTIAKNVGVLTSEPRPAATRNCPKIEFSSNGFASITSQSSAKLLTCTTGNGSPGTVMVIPDGNAASTAAN